MEFPDRKYNILLLDPPWKYNARNNKNTRFGGGAGGHYPLMSMEEIKALPIQDIAADNCAMFLWATFPYLDEQIKLFEHWGFIYKTLGFSWIKLNTRNKKPFFGVGYYAKCLRGSSKIFILNKRTNNIEYINISDLKDYSIEDIQISTHLGWRNIIHFQKNSDTQVKTITTDIGTITTSYNHRLFYKYVSLPRNKDNPKKRVHTHLIACDDVVEIARKSESQKKRSLGCNLLFPAVNLEKQGFLELVDGVQLSNELAWIMGLFVAEGNYGTKHNLNQVRFSLHSKETGFYHRIKNYIDSLQLRGDRYFNSLISVSLFKHKHAKSISVYFSSKKVKSIFNTFIFGLGSHGKRLNLNLLFQTSTKFRENFLQGILDGDGYKEKGLYQRLTLCNKELIEDIRILCQTLGIATTQHDRVSTDRFGNKFPAYALGFKTPRKNYSFEGVEMLPIGIKSITNEGNLEDTYDISVEGEAFIVNGLLSHNSNCEVCLMGIKGKMKPVSNKVSSVVLSPRERHSKKPDVVRERIVELFGDVPRIELFARETTPGWTAWGLEIDP